MQLYLYQNGREERGTNLIVVLVERGGRRRKEEEEEGGHAELADVKEMWEEK